MFQVVVGHSIDVDSDDAIDEVITQCLTHLNGQQPQAGILFSAIDFEHGIVLARIHEIFPDLALIGGTTDAEMSSVLGFQEDSLTLMLFCSDTVKIHAGLGRNLSMDAAAGAQQAVKTLGLTASDQIKLCITIPDGLKDGVEPAINHLQQLFPSGLPIVGGRSGDQYRLKNTYQFFGQEVLQDSLPILVFCGDLKVSSGVASGWQPLSRKAVITKAKGTVVYEIDHQPAKTFYKEYTGEQPIFGEYPLAVFEADQEHFYLRASSHWDVEEESIVFMGLMPEKATVQITYATADQIIAATQTSIEQARIRYPGNKPTAALMFSCASRRWLLGNRANEECELSRQFLDNSIPMVGFYTYGEISPLEMASDARYHQETFVTVLLGET